MTAEILDGRALAKTMRAELDEEVAAFKEKYGVTPTIAVVRAGEDPGSVWYSNAIKKTMAGQGMEAQLHVLPETARGNVVHHYDLDERLFRLFLDPDLQYSCG